MSMQSSPPPSQRNVEANNPMKAFVLLVLLILLFVFLSVSGIARVNLTPDTPAVGAQSFLPVEPQVIMIQDSTPGLAVVPETVFVPVTGAATCSDPYVVRQGDNLSQIAVLCNTTVGAIRLANPQISNINLIYPGMLVRIPGGAPAPLPEPVPVAGGDKDPFFQWTATPDDFSFQLIEPTPQPNIETTAVFRAGTQMTVRAINLPPASPVSIAVGPLGGEYQIIGMGMTDELGNFVGSITVPESPQAAILPHVVVISTTSPPISQTISPPFFISPANP
jgi:LysM repeat protein